MMIKKYSLFVFIIVSLFSYGQEITFQKNGSSNAAKLLVVQKLNRNKDSLILESGKIKISQVDILNDDYLETIKVDSTKAKIDLTKLPHGNYVIQARVDKHWVVMYMVKREYSSTGLNFTDAKINTKLNHISVAAKDSKDKSVITKQDSLENHLEDNTMYWVVYESNSSFSSVKTMSLKYPEEINNLISKIKLEVNSGIGKNNKLFIYEVYNTAEFMSNQLRNCRYYKKEESKLFNVSPLYSFENKKDNRS